MERQFKDEYTRLKKRDKTAEYRFEEDHEDKMNSMFDLYTPGYDLNKWVSHRYGLGMPRVGKILSMYSEFKERIFLYKILW